MHELTLAILKPHVLKQPHVLQNIRDLIIKSNFKIVRSKQVCLRRTEAEEFYTEHRDKFFFNRLVTFMTSGPSDFYILCRINAIKEWRRLMGPTKVFKTQFQQPETIRGLYGLSDTRNATHGSDSKTTAQREISIFFPDFQWNDKYYFVNDLVKFVEKDFVHIPVNK